MECQQSKVEQLIEGAARYHHTELYLSYCDISELPDALFQLTHLRELILTGNEIEFIPEDISKLSQLRVLDIAGNRVRTLPNAITRLSFLQRLELASNEITQLPESIEKLTNLDYLDCFGNQLRTLPGGLAKCHNLTVLRLAENELSTLPASLGALSQLRILDLSDNELTSLPDSMVRLTRLTELHLNGNLLNLPVHIISKLTYQPVALVAAYIDVKEKERIEQQVKEDEIAKKTKQHKKVFDWIREQQLLIEHYHFSSESVELKFELSGRSNLAQLSEAMSLVGQMVSELAVTSNKLLSELGVTNSIKPGAIAMLNETLSCSAVNWLEDQQGGILTVTLQAPPIQQKLVALTCSLWMMQFQYREMDSDIQLEAVGAQLNDMLGTGYGTMTLTWQQSFAKAIIMLAQRYSIYL